MSKLSEVAKRILYNFLLVKNLIDMFYYDPHFSHPPPLSSADQIFAGLIRSMKLRNISTPTSKNVGSLVGANSTVHETMSVMVSSSMSQRVM